MGAPGKVVRQLDEGAAQMIAASAQVYVDNWKRFSKGLKRIDG
jgi:carbonic anhydrase/acetyltransferase-like protein (isoleucine patch superfamily)